MKKILFCTTPYHPYNLADEKVYVVEPIQFEVLSSLLSPETFDMELLDLRIERKKNVFERKLKEFKPDILCMTSWTMHADTVKNHFKTAKIINPNIITIVGGEHTRISPKDFAIEETDFVVMGEGYESFPKLLSYIDQGNQSYNEISGIAYRENGQFFSNGQGIIRRDFNLNDLPHPRRSLAKKYSKKYYHLWWKPIASLRTSMGCPAKCSFCNLWKVNLGKYLTWSPEYIVDVLKTIDEPYVLFVDDHFFADVKRAMTIGEAILKAGIKKQYCLYSRSDSISEHPELIELWAKVGLKRVRMGLESYSDRTLENKNKCATTDHNNNAIRILKKYNVLTEGLFIIELDYTEKHFSEMAAYITEQKIEVPNITVSTPMPGTVDYKLHEPQMIYKKSVYFDFQHATMPTKLELKEFCRLYSKLIIKVQRPLFQQIKLIGLWQFLRKMPNFWRYFWSLRTSYKHYNPAEPGAGISEDNYLPWINNQMQKTELNQFETANKLYFREA